jgi:hypothetical protein
MMYTTKPVQVEARQWDGTAAEANTLVAWVQAGGMLAYYDTSQLPDALYVVINTLNGPLHASPQDWLVCGTSGEFSVYKPDEFAAMFAPVP